MPTILSKNNFQWEKLIIISYKVVNYISQKQQQIMLEKKNEQKKWINFSFSPLSFLSSQYFLSSLNVDIFFFHLIIISSFNHFSSSSFLPRISDSCYWLLFFIFLNDVLIFSLFLLCVRLLMLSHRFPFEWIFWLMSKRLKL